MIKRISDIISDIRYEIMNLCTIRTDKNNVDFVSLTHMLDEELFSIHGEKQNEYAPFNSLDKITDVVIIYDRELPVACGGLREYDKTTVEIKRMYVLPEYRGRALGERIMAGLEDIAIKKGYNLAILESSVHLVAAVKLYKRLGYIESENFRSGECGLWMKKKLI